MEDVKTAPELPNIQNFDKAHLLSMEKEMMGVYLSGHPLDKYRDLIDENITANTAEIFDSNLSGDGENESDFIDDRSSGTSRFNDGDTVIIAGMVGDLRRMITKSTRRWQADYRRYYGVSNCDCIP